MHKHVIKSKTRQIIAVSHGAFAVAFIACNASCAATDNSVPFGWLSPTAAV